MTSESVAVEAMRPMVFGDVHILELAAPPPLEQMARALAAARWRRYPNLHCEVADTADAFAERQWGLYVRDVDDLLDALAANISDEMVEAGGWIEPDPDGYDTREEYLAENKLLLVETFRAMLTAAKGERG